ncbi:hypothetical protein JX265_010576 [Neoarthrinium moseri]|uniref:DNA-binding protein RAP1 n=1 Tax=Neoarthrinium moseri TaxID=1658444 RepID=A0A9P9WE06_9PEZI|nr:hypothetical protein JX265_010576 [Neoarthrinium moseri]
MPAPIVYEGQVHGHGGRLFKDIKFWVAHRVPMRATWIQDIENNGGSIEKLEKNADYLIADHVRKDAPAGSYSWKWIEDSVKSGQLLDPNDYSINLPGTASRPVGSVQQRTTRTAFTREDDILLARYVTKHERNGLAVQGLAIYKILEKKYPHHTYQSWRDRWVKKLQHQPRPEVSDSELSPPPPDDHPAHASAPSPAARRTGSQTPQVTTAPTADPASSRRPTRARFSTDEDELVIQYVKECEKFNKSLSGSIIWKELAEDFPQHSWQSWRERWLKQLKPRLQSREDDGLSRPATPSSVGSRVEQVRNRKSPRKPTLEVVQEGESAPHTKTNTTTRSPVIEKRRRGQQEELIKAEGMGKEHYPEPAISGRRNTSEVAPTDEHESNVAESSRQSGDSGAHQSNEDPPSPSVSSSQALLSEGKEQFYRDLGVFAANDSQRDSPLNLWPTIQGRTFELWDLWNAAISKKVDPVERDWQQIAEDLGYDWIQLPDAPDEIRRCYEANLSAFEEVLEGFEDEDEEDEEDEANTLPAIQPEVFPESSNAPFNSSPPKQPSLKRRFELELPSDHLYPESARKRSRLSRDGEVPSTPDTKNGTSHLRHSISAGVSPSDQKLSGLPKSSRAAHHHNARALLNKEDEHTNDQIHEPPVDDEDALETQPEMTPSQQLHSEFNAENRRRQLNEQTSPTPKRNVKSPFVVDDEDNDSDDDDMVEQITPKPLFGKGPNPLLSQPELLKVKRRSLPASLMASSKSAPAQRKSMPGPSRSPAQKSPSPPAPPRQQTQAEKLADVVDYWTSLGYPRAVARRCLEATTWEPGLAGRLMQMLKDGESMPTNWEGVWSPRDDESLLRIDAADAAGDEKEARKRQRALDRLLDKHGEERITLRRKWLATKAKL